MLSIRSTTLQRGMVVALTSQAAAASKPAAEGRRHTKYTGQQRMEAARSDYVCAENSLESRVPGAKFSI